MRRGLMRERAAKFRSLVIAPVLALAVTTCMWGVANAREFSDNALRGGYGCLTTFIDIDGQLDQLVFDGKGKITSGEKLINEEGEVCTVPVDPVGSSYTVNPDGTGTLTIHLATATPADGDEKVLCAFLSGASEHFAIVVESSGKRVELNALDPFWSGGGFTTAGTDENDFVQTGACNRQVGG